MTEPDIDTLLLTKAVRSQLRSERVRTDVTAIQLLSGRDDVPAGLTPGIVNRWMNGLIRSAPRPLFDYVIERWAALPDGSDASAGAPRLKRGKRYPTSSRLWIEVTSEMAALLRAELARTGVDHASLLDDVADVPRGLNARIVKGWLYREAETTRTAHWTFVVECLRNLPDMTTPLSPAKRKKL